MEPYTNGTMSDEPSPPAILVAEDDPNDLILLRMALEKAGSTHVLQSFGNGAEVIQFLRQFSMPAEGNAPSLPRLLFLDLHLPQIDGGGVIAWIRRQKYLAGLRIVVVSGSGDPLDAKQATALGADRLLVKPPPVEALLAEIARLDELRPAPDAAGA